VEGIHDVLRLAVKPTSRSSEEIRDSSSISESEGRRALCKGRQCRASCEYRRDVASVMLAHYGIRERVDTRVRVQDG
jgi:hypothetical protein